VVGLDLFVIRNTGVEKSVLFFGAFLATFVTALHSGAIRLNIPNVIDVLTIK
jgi:hypothetical protein